jgi:hypothetical protein
MNSPGLDMGTTRWPAVSIEGHRITVPITRYILIQFDQRRLEHYIILEVQEQHILGERVWRNGFVV